MRPRRRQQAPKLRGVDTAAARANALADAVRMLAPAAVAIREKHGDFVARAVLQAARDDCALNPRQRARKSVLQIAGNNDA